MKTDEIITTLQKNRDANKDHPKFFEACGKAITALQENIQLKNRCFALSDGALCSWCNMECNAIGKPKAEGDLNEIN